VAATYRSGINIKFGKAYFDFLGQVTYNTSDGADWSKGAIMFDFPSFHPNSGDGKRYNEQFCNGPFPMSRKGTKTNRWILFRHQLGYHPHRRVPGAPALDQKHP
jgi:hypothetical protein